MPQSIFTSLPDQARASLSKLSRDLDGVVPIEIGTWTFATEGLSPSVGRPPVIAEVDSWAEQSKLCLYYLECLSPSVDLVNVRKFFAEAKAHEDKDRAYPRLNRLNACFYVGSSQAVAKRFGEHLGYGPARTYALQLAHWAQPLKLSMQFVCAKYADKTAYATVQALEDALWETKQPMFGRQGRK